MYQEKYMKHINTSYKKGNRTHLTRSLLIDLTAHRITRIRDKF